MLWSANVNLWVGFQGKMAKASDMQSKQTKPLNAAPLLSTALSLLELALSLHHLCPQSEITNVWFVSLGKDFNIILGIGCPWDVIYCNNSQISTEILISGTPYWNFLGRKILIHFLLLPYYHLNPLPLLFNNIRWTHNLIKEWFS